MKIKLKKATIEKYTSIETTQTFEVDNNVTVLVGMNESGKTSVLKALAKTNYFEKDADFEYSVTHDYPRKEKKALDKAKTNPVAVKGEYELSDELITDINKDLGERLYTQKIITYSKKYDNVGSYGNVVVKLSTFLANFITINKITDEKIKESILKINKVEDFTTLMSDEAIDKEIKNQLEGIKKYFENKWKWQDDPISEYIARMHIDPNMPKYLYYDEYYTLP